MRSILKRISAFALAASIALLPISADAQFAPGPGLAGSGTVTSVGLTGNAMFNITSSPVITAGAINLNYNSQSANFYLAAPNGSAGVPSFRAMVGADLPNPTAGVKGGVSAIAPLSHFWINSITSGTGVPVLTQPDYSDLSGNLPSAQIDTMAGTSTQGSIFIRGASGWTGLAPSTGGILQSNGAGANPSWVSPSAAIPAAVGIGHRLTIQTATPVLTSPVASATTIYSTPYNSDLMLLWNGTNFVPTHCAETSQTLADTTKSPAAAVAGTVYDMFAWNDAGTCRVTRGPAWTSNAARSAGTAIARTNFGILTNSVAITNGPGINAGTYMGSIITDSGGVTISYLPNATSLACTIPGTLPIWNMYNRTKISISVTLSQASHATTATGNSTFYNGTASCGVRLLRGQDEDIVDTTVTGFIALSSVVTGSIGIGLASAVPVSSGGAASIAVLPTGGINYGSDLTAKYQATMGVGLVILNATETNNAGAAAFSLGDAQRFSLTANTQF